MQFRDFRGAKCEVQKARMHSVHPGSHPLSSPRLARIASWLAGIASWLDGVSSWLAGVSSWLAGVSSWLAGVSFWLAEVSSWLAGVSSRLAGLLPCWLESLLNLLPEIAA